MDDSQVREIYKDYNEGVRHLILLIRLKGVIPRSLFHYFLSNFGGVMRRGTPGAIQIGQVLFRIRLQSGMTQRQVAARIGVTPATVSQIEKAQRSLKKPNLWLWAKGYGVEEEWLKEQWLEADALEEPPIVRKHTKSISEKDLNELIRLLSSSERERVRGYVESILSNPGR